MINFVDERNRQPVESVEIIDKPYGNGRELIS